MQPRHFQPGEGKTFKIGRMSMTFKTTAAEDWSAYTVCEAIEPTPVWRRLPPSPNI